VDGGAVVKRFVSRFALGTVVGLACLAVACCSVASGASPKVPACTLLGIAPTQICPVTFTATAGTKANVVVARYSDLSRCNITPPAGYPGNDGNYVVALITINWGDDTPATSGVAHTGKTCPGTSISAPYGTAETITGVHRYAKSGTYRVSVSITYRRGKGNTYKNCAKVRPGGTRSVTNCIGEGSPVTSIGVVHNRS
jgi:hypothetical protein